MNLENYLSSPVSEIANAAKLLKQVIVDYQDKAVSREEYFELASNILDYKSIIANVSDMNTRQEIIDAFSALLMIVKSIPINP